jgi:hypothetical protein
MYAIDEITLNYLAQFGYSGAMVENEPAKSFRNRIIDLQRIKDGIDNALIVEQAKNHVINGNFKNAISLFEKSIVICQRQDWMDGIRYAKEQIDKMKNL